MEFSLFFQGYVPEFRRAVDPEAEHHAFMNELAAVQAADRSGFKYAWVTEHHFLDEYSHLSANDVILGYLAHATERIHIGSGIFNPLPKVNHPAKVAERVTMLDHLSEGRFEFGTGRGAGSHEILGFLGDVADMNVTKDIWADVIREFPKMFLQDTYEGYDGTYWSLPPRKILPKPYGPAHPAMWYAAGSTSSWEMAGEMGLGVLGFAIDDLSKFEKVRAVYKDRVANCEPIGAFANDNVMICIGLYLDEDRDKARQQLVDARPNYLTSNVFRYHDTFPSPDWVPGWPELIPDVTLDTIDQGIDAGGFICGDPDDAVAQVQRWADVGLDQLCFGIGTATPEQTVRSIELFGEHVIPNFDTEPTHSTTRYREAAGPAPAS